MWVNGVGNSVGNIVGNSVGDNVGNGVGKIVLSTTLLYGPTLWTHPVDPPCGPTL